MTTIRLTTATGAAAAPRSRRLSRAKQARMFTTTYGVILGVIAALLAAATADIVPAVLANDASACPLASTYIFTALAIFVFVLPAVAALQLRVERVRGER